MTTEEMIKVMQAHVDGKQIEYSPIGGHCAGRWGVCKTPLWTWGEFNYRIKPETLNIHIYKHNSSGLYHTQTAYTEPVNWAYVKSITVEI